jgi:hypothetical protein
LSDWLGARLALVGEPLPMPQPESADISLAAQLCTGSLHQQILVQGEKEAPALDAPGKFRHDSRKYRERPSMIWIVSVPDPVPDAPVQFSKGSKNRTPEVFFTIGPERIGVPSFEVICLSIDLIEPIPQVLVSFIPDVPIHIFGQKASEITTEAGSRQQNDRRNLKAHRKFSQTRSRRIRKLGKGTNLKKDRSFLQDHSAGH